MSSPLEHLNLVAEEIYVPMLMKTAATKRWPQALTSEVMANFHRLINDIYVTIGEVQGTTKLPLPPPESGAGSAGDTSARAHKRSSELEATVMSWTKQIKNILRADPEAKLKQPPPECNVGPEVEIKFWNFKAKNLISINEQLEGEKISSLRDNLHKANSPLAPAFEELIPDVKAALAEAVSNVKFLKPLDEYLIKLRMSDNFEDLIQIFTPIMHTLMMIWQRSPHYNAPSRLVTLMREMSNDMIAQAQKFLGAGNAILQDDPIDAVDKLKTTLRVCGMLKTAYFTYKTRVFVQCPQNPWRFQNSALFARLDAFLERCHDILEVCNTKLQYVKLERIEVGGTKGKVLTASVAQIYVDFLRAIAKFDHIEYDILNVETKVFDTDFYAFRVAIKDMERRLGAVVTQGFDDCTTVYGCFKLLDSFDTLLEREVIMQDLEKKHLEL